MSNRNERTFDQVIADVINVIPDTEENADLLDELNDLYESVVVAPPELLGFYCFEASGILAEYLGSAPSACSDEENAARPAWHLDVMDAWKDNSEDEDG